MKHLHKIFFPVLIFALVFIVIACSKSMTSSPMRVSYDEAEFLSESIEYAGRFRDDSSIMAVEDIVQGRKLTKRADLRLRVDDTADTEDQLSELMNKYGAWSESTGIYENSLNYTIRVHSGFYDEMLNELAGLGRVLRRTENAEDVTLRYYDLESRLATRKELLKTYQDYLGKAANIEEIMIVESRIADLQREIDNTGTQFRNLSNLIDYSTINLNIAGPVNAVTNNETTFGEKLKQLFGSFGKVASTTLLVLTGILIYGIPAVLIFIFVFWFLFGRLGLLKRLMFFAVGKKTKK